MSNDIQSELDKIKQKQYKIYSVAADLKEGKEPLKQMKDQKKHEVQKIEDAKRKVEEDKRIAKKLELDQEKVKQSILAIKKTKSEEPVAPTVIELTPEEKAALVAKVKSQLVTSLCIIQFLSNSAFSQMSPFYPLKAKSRGISVLNIGFVIGTMAFTQIISSIIIGKFLHKIGGRQSIILLGSLLIIIQTGMLGYLEYVDDPQQFLIYSYVAQVCGGFGAGANCTACMAILSSFESQEREEYIGYIEAANGIGLLFGPLMGAFLFTLGGYTLPFMTFSALYFIAYPYIWMSLSRSKSQIENEEGAIIDDENKKEDIELKALLSKPRFVFGLLAQMMMMMSIQFLAPNLAIHLQQYGYSPEMIGLAYGIPAILYATSCPFMYLATQRIQKRGIILLGFVQVTFAMLMIGGSDSLIEFQKQPVFIFLGLCMIGLSAGMVTIPVLPEMLESIEEDEELSDKYDMNSVENYISGLFVSFQSLGEALGPILGSVLTEQFSFAIGQEIYALILAVFFTSYFLTCGNFQMFYTPQKAQVDDMEKDNLIPKQQQQYLPEPEIEEQEDLEENSQDDEYIKELKQRKKKLLQLKAQQMQLKQQVQE